MGLEVLGCLIIMGMGLQREQTVSPRRNSEVHGWVSMLLDAIPQLTPLDLYRMHPSHALSRVIKKSMHPFDPAPHPLSPRFHPCRHHPHPQTSMRLLQLSNHTLHHPLVISLDQDHSPSPSDLESSRLCRIVRAEATWPCRHWRIEGLSREDSMIGVKE